MLGDVTFRKISSLRDFSLEILRGYRTCGIPQSMVQSILEESDHFCKLENCDTLTLLVIFFSGGTKNLRTFKLSTEYLSLEF